MLSKIDEAALINIKSWFGEGNVVDVQDFLDA